MRVKAAIYFCLSTFSLMGQGIDTIYCSISKIPEITDNGFFSIQDTVKNYIKSGIILNEKMEGPWLHSRDGKLIKVINYENSQIHGLVITFNDDQLLSLENYNKGRLNGFSIFYHNSGAVKKTLEFNNGVLEVEYVYSINGTMIRESIYSSKDSLNFNSAFCGDDYVMLQTMINDTIEFNGNQWYPSGIEKVTCIKSLNDVSTVLFEYFNSEGVLLLKGAYKYSCTKRSYCCWKRSRNWIWYDKNKNVLKTKVYPID